MIFFNRDRPYLVAYQFRPEGRELGVGQIILSAPSRIRIAYIPDIQRAIENALAKEHGECRVVIINMMPISK